MFSASKHLGVSAVCLTLAAIAPTAVRGQAACSGVSPANNGVLSGVTVVSGIAGRPDFVAAPNGDTSRIFIVEKSGQIFIHKHGTPPTSLTTFLDIRGRVDSSSNELGLLGLAFDPSYASTGAFWLNYTETVSGITYTVVARYSVQSGNPDAADPASEQRALRFVQPQTNHNGGMLAFGGDGFLYVFNGDGGGQGDSTNPPCGNGQNKTVLLGKTLRLDVRGIDPAATAPDCGAQGGNPTAYKVPLSNPFRDGAGGSCDEIWSYGLRNPWRSTFDALNGDLYTADVGQSCWEEIDWRPGSSTGGENYGWRQMEGYQCYNPNDTSTCTPVGSTCAGSPPCHDPSITDPVLAYGHGDGCAVVGGYVYRGCKMPLYRGTYFYGDYCSGFVKTFQISGGVATNPTDVSTQVDPTFSLSGGLTSFGTDGQGEIYITNELNGSVLKIAPPFGALEVAGPGAGAPFLLGKSTDWTWEDLFLATDQPVTVYRVYRGKLGGPYSCVFKAPTNRWPGGDPVVPSTPGQLFTYVVTAVNAAGTETLPGTAGTFDATTCP